MSAGRWILALSMGVVLASCGDETGSSTTGLNGSFEGRYPGAPADRLDDQYLGLSLVENNGVVSGHAFYWYTPGYAATVNGTFDGEEFDLTLRAVFYGATDLRQFRGRMSGDTLSGELSVFGHPGWLVQTWRTDTTARGTYEATYEGAVAETRQGPAYFTYGNEGARVLLELDVFPIGPSIAWQSTQRPQVGRYEFGGSSPTGSITIPRDGGGTREFPAQSGWIEIDVSTRHTLTGRFDLVGRESGGFEPLRVHGAFSAGCAVQYC